MHLAILRTLSSLAPGGLTTVARLPPRLPSSWPRIPLGTNTTLAQNAHRSELTRSLSSDKNSRQSVHDYKPRPASRSLGSPVCHCGGSCSLEVTTPATSAWSRLTRWRERMQPQCLMLVRPQHTQETHWTILPCCPVPHS